MSVTKCVPAAALVLMAVVTCAEGAVEGNTIIAQHGGATDPTSAAGGRWATEPARPGIRPVALRGSRGQPDAWQINAVGKGGLDYVKRLAKSDLTKLDNGFVLSARLKVIERADKVDAGIAVRCRNGQTSWFLRFGSTPAGDPIVDVRGGGGPLVLTGAGPGYHLYEIKDPDGDGEADFYVDGALKRRHWMGSGDGRPAQINWGNGSGKSRGNAAFSLVRLEASPKRPGPRRKRWNEVNVYEKSVFETKTILFGKRKFCYVDEGKGKRTIFLIRGNRFCEKKWDKQIPAFVAAGYRVVSPYRPGTGGSDYVDFMSKATVSQDNWALLDCLGIEKAVLVGHCGGARMAWQMYLTRPLATEAFINFDSGLFGKLKPRKPYLKRMDAETRAMYDRNKETLAKIDRLWDYPSDYNTRRMLRNKAWGQIRAEHARRTSLQADERDLEPKRRHYCHVPVLSITCGRGRIKQSHPEAVTMEKALKRKRAKSLKFVVITKAGHYPNQEQTELFNRTILDFLATLPAPK